MNRTLYVGWLPLLSFSIAGAQTASISLADAVAKAEVAYPTIRISRSQIDAAAAQVRFARTAYLPRVDGVAQLDRGTHNNVFGPTLPQAVLSPISGPVIDTSFRSAWGSAVGVLVAWEPIDFGQRRASIETAGATKRRAEAAAELTRFQVGAVTADAYLTVVAADATVRAARAAVTRAQVVLESAKALVNSGLRPGADLERAVSENASANLQWIQAEQAAATARVTLAQMIGSDAGVQSAEFVGEAAGKDSASGETVAHPALAEQRRAIDEAKARSAQLDLAYFPKIQLMANLYARGSGARVDSTTGGAIAGIGPNIGNWVAGFQITFPILELPSLRAKREAERKHLEGESARLDLVRLELNAHLEKARVALDSARRMAQQTPILVESARRAEAQMSARYRAGLVTMTEMADVSRTLAQAEIDHSLARLNIWRARLSIAAAEGDLAPFLEAVKQAGGR